MDKKLKIMSTYRKHRNGSYCMTERSSARSGNKVNKRGNALAAGGITIFYRSDDDSHQEREHASGGLERAAIVCCIRAA